MTTPDNPPAMRPGDPMRFSGARWCEEHNGRWECSRQRSRGRGDCHGSAMTGTDRCRMHLGAASSAAKREGAVNMAAWSVLAAMELPARDAGLVVMAALEQSVMRCEVYGELLRLLVEDEDYGGLIGVTRAAGRDGAVVESGEQYRGLVKLEQSERRLMVDIAAKAHGMGIAERVVELHQAHAQLVFDAYVRSLEAVPSLLPAQKDAMLRAFLAGIGADVGHDGPDGSGVGVLGAGGGGDV